jgi:hypothetical protein
MTPIAEVRGPATTGAAAPCSGPGPQGIVVEGPPGAGLRTAAGLWTAADELSARYGIVWLRGTKDRTRSVAT